MIGKTNGGSGGTGATLTVTAPAGCTVTVSKDGKTKTKTAGADGLAVFKGLETGTWTVTITDGEQTAQKTVTVTADYETAITFFSATINVTYPAGSTCTATDGVRILESDDSGTFAFTVDNVGPWTVTSTYDTATVTACDGETVDLDLARYYLVRNGQVNTDRLGTMNRAGKTNSSGSVFLQTPWVTQGEDRITYGLNKGSDGWEAGIVYSSKKIDLTPFSELTIEGSCHCMKSGGDAQVRAWTSIGSNVDANAVFAFTPNRDNIMIASTPINIAKECLIGFSMWVNRSFSANIVIKNLYLG